jgi:hypothetical protein
VILRLKGHKRLKRLKGCLGHTNNVILNAVKDLLKGITLSALLMVVFEEMFHFVQHEHARGSRKE